MDAKRIAGPVKAAILIHALGRPLADILLKRLSASEKEIINNHLSQIRTISPEVVEQVSKEFALIAQRYKSKSSRSVSAKSVQAQNGSDDLNVEGNGLKALSTLSAEEIYDLIRNVHLNTRVASDVIAKLPDEIKTEVSMRIVNLDKVTATIVDEVNEILKDILKTKRNAISKVTGGVDRLAEILNQTDEISSELILNEMEEVDMEMAAQIKQRMFVFEDIILVDDRGVQKLLRKVETMELAIALKAASEEVKEKIFKNMSERAGEMLKEEIEDMGPVRMKEVEDSQQNITNIIQEMETKGELIIAGRRGDTIIA